MFEDEEYEEEESTLFGSSEMYMPKGQFEALTNIQTRDLQKLGVKYSNGIPLLQTIVALHKTYRLVRGSLKGAGIDEDSQQIKALQEAEKLTAYQIKNQRDLGMLVEKDIAKVRMIDALAGIQNMLISAIKEAAVEFPGNERDNIELLTDIFIGASDRIMQEQGSILSWEMDGGSALLPTSVLQERIIQSRLSRSAELNIDAEAKTRESDINPLKEIDDDYD